MENTQDQTATLAAEAIKFLNSLENTFAEDPPQEKLAAIRQCTEKIFVNKPKGSVILKIRLVPLANLQETRELQFSI